MVDMTQTPGQITAPTHTTGLDRFFDWLRSIDLRRDGEDKWLAGVCSGIATRLGVDPIVIRAVLVALVVMGGVGITVYLIAWAFLPNDKETIVAERAIRDGDVLGIILLVVVALSLVGGTGVAGDWGGVGWLWWVALPIGLVVWLVMRNRTPGQVHRAAAQTGTWTAETSDRMAQASVDLADRASTSGQTGYAGQAGYAGAAPGAPTAPYGPGPVPPTAPYGSAPYGSAPYGSAPYGSGPVPPVPPAPPKRPIAPRPPRAPRRRGAGFVGALLVSGAALAAYGTALWLHDANNWSGSDETVALAAALGVFGIGILVIGLLGRRASLTAFIAVILAITTWSASVVPNLTFGGGIGERVWRPTATDTTERYRLGIGQGELDLTELPDNPTTPREIDAGVGIGELRIRIPENLTVEVRSSVGAGDISQANPGGPLGELPPFPANGDRDVFDNSRSNRDGTDISTTQVFGTGSADVIVNAHVGLGQILIGKE